MFYPKAKIMVSGADKLTAQARETSAAAAGRARDATSSARGRVAPWLESAADYTTDTVAPKVSSVLRDTARQIGPPDSRRQGSRLALRWSLLATAALAAAGAAALLVRQRYRAAMAADTEDAETPTETPVEPTPTTEVEPTTPTDSVPVDRPADAGVNGKVSAPG